MPSPGSDEPIRVAILDWTVRPTEDYLRAGASPEIAGRTRIGPGTEETKDMRRRAWLGFLLLAVSLPLLSGCATVSVRTVQYLGLPTYPPTAADTIEILHVEPLRPHQRLGEIILQPSGGPPVTEMENKLRDAAAKLGANAVVLVADRTERMGAIITGPWWGRSVDPTYGRVIVAVAIRYTG
jgi:hypothetical protein